MRWDADEEERESGYVVRIAMAMAVVVIAILSLVLFLNKDMNKSGRAPVSQQTDAQTGNDTPNIAPTQGAPEQGMSDGRTSDELDIWDEDYSSVLEETPTPTQEPEEDVTTDGNHTKVTYADGSSNWLTISPRIEHNDYRDMNFVYQTPIMKYYEDGVLVSYMGMMVSEEQNYIDYIKLKSAGVDFVMVHLGGRDAQSGELYLDAQFAQNMKNAVDAGLHVGVWFESQAKDTVEAAEEAQFVLDYLSEYTLTYPVACVHTPTAYEESARTDALGKAQRTECARTFMDLMEQNGFRTVLGANKEYLILKFDLADLEEEDIWLMQEGDVPDYPYFYSMWSYDGHGVIDGIEHTAGMIIAMKDLSVQ